MKLFERSELIEIRNLAQDLAKSVVNENWKRAYLTLADAADRLDAMIARSTVVAREG